MQLYIKQIKKIIKGQPKNLCGNTREHWGLQLDTLRFIEFYGMTRPFSLKSTEMHVITKL